MPEKLNIIRWKCLTCNTIHDEFSQASRCEKSHFHIENFSISFVSDEKACSIDWPMHIGLISKKEGAEGVKATYKFCKQFKR